MSSAGTWLTADGRFLLYRPVRRGGKRIDGRWEIAVHPSSQSHDADRTLLLSVGLAGPKPNRFPTRREALQALTLAAYPAQ